MAEQEKPTLHVDTDWKRQAQEEKRRLAEEEQKRRQQAASAAGPATGSAGASGHPAQQGGRESRQVPPASFSMLVQSLLTQALYHLGDLAARGSAPVVDLDMARHSIDTLGILEEKTRGNLTPEEKAVLDRALYEARMRFVAVASEVASYP